MLKRPNRSERIKVELLDHNENAIDSIEQDVDSSEAGKIVSNNNQGTRKSCSFTLINMDAKYTINENNFFWFNRKFRLYKGIADNKDTFWFTKGVFITQQADADSTARTVSIQGVDKYAQLDGTLNVLQADEFDTVFEIGVKVETVIRDVLMLDIGNGRPLDPIEPIIDHDIGSKRLYKEYTISAGSYYGDFFSEIMSSFGCDIYYDNFGRLRVQRVFNDDVPWFYAFKSSVYDFGYNEINYIAPRLSAQLNGVNKIVVQTDNTYTENAEYVAYNRNPRSPLCYDKIGARTYRENGGIVYISSGDAEIDTPEQKCKEYAEYMLFKETCFDLAMDFSCPTIPHINENDVVTISDAELGLDSDAFLVLSISESLDTGETTISAVNLKYLPTDIYNSAIASTVRNPNGLRAIGIVYSLNGGSGEAPERQTIDYYDSFKPVFPKNASRNYTKEGNEYLGWSTSPTASEAKYNSAEKSYSAPSENTTLYAVWDSTDGCYFRVEVDDVSKLSTSGIPVKKCFSTAPEYTIINGSKQYLQEINQSGTMPVYLDISWVSGKLTFIHGSSKSNYRSLDVSEMLNELGNYLLYYARSTNAVTKLCFPDILPDKEIELNRDFAFFRASEIHLPKHELSISGADFISNVDGLKTFDFDYDLTLGSNADTLYYCPDLQNVHFGGEVTSTGSGYLIESCDNIIDITFDKAVTLEAEQTSGLPQLAGSCAKLENMTIKGDMTVNGGSPDSRCTVGTYCTALNAVEIGGKLTVEFGDLFHNYCESLETLTIGSADLKTTQIGDPYNKKLTLNCKGDLSMSNNCNVYADAFVCDGVLTARSVSNMYAKSVKASGLNLSESSYIFNCENIDVSGDILLGNGAMIYYDSITADSLSAINGGGIAKKTASECGDIIISGKTEFVNSGNLVIKVNRFETGDLKLSGTNFPPNGGIIGELQVNGELNIPSGGSYFAYNFEIGNFYVEGDSNISYALFAPTSSSNGIVTHDDSEFVFRGNYIASDNSFVNIPSSFRLEFCGEVNVSGTNGSASFIVGNNGLTEVVFRSSVNFSGSTFMCGNYNLTDVYFYSDDIDLGTGSSLMGNDPNFTIHGIRGGKAEQIALEKGLKFEPI